MAKVHTEVLVVKLSKLVKDSETEMASSVTEDLVTAVEQIAQELCPEGVVVEVEVAE